MKVEFEIDCPTEGCAGIIFATYHLNMHENPVGSGNEVLVMEDYWADECRICTREISDEQLLDEIERHREREADRSPDDNF